MKISTEVGMDFIKVVLTSLLAIVALFIITKMIGHKQVAQLDFFDYITGITIGSIGAELATELESPWKPLVAIVVYGAVSALLGALTHKISKTRKYVNGAPAILMNGGKIFRENMKKAKLDLSEFLLLCRERGFFDLEDIQTAVFETNGKLSILQKSEKRPLTPSDVKISPSLAEIGVEIIMDGEIMGENLKRLGRDGRWLDERIRMAGYKCAEEILLCIYKSNEDKTDFYPIE
jgi:uncharacterized membrane protein YcaP (DUF421 family)